jgi:ribosomal protein L18
MGETLLLHAPCFQTLVFAEADSAEAEARELEEAEAAEADALALLAAERAIKEAQAEEEVFIFLMRVV